MSLPDLIECFITLTDPDGVNVISTTPFTCKVPWYHFGIRHQFALTEVVIDPGESFPSGFKDVELVRVHGVLRLADCEHSTLCVNKINEAQLPHRRQIL